MGSANVPPVAAPKAGPKATRPRRQPVRTCVACRTTGGKQGLLRVVRLPETTGKAHPENSAEVGYRVALDRTGKQSGRGAYVCPTLTCVQTALKRKALDRSLKVTITEDVAASLEAAVVAATKVAESEAAPTAEESARPFTISGGEMPPGT